MGVIIETPQLRMEIKFLSVESLFTHEETIPTALNQLKNELVEEQVLKHPIIVDAETHVVLDGMHRVAALKSLDCNIVPVCLVDYQNPAIELYAWYREFNGQLPIKSLLDKLDFTIKYDQVQISPIRAQEMVNQRSAIAALVNRNTVFILASHSSLTIKEVYDKVAVIETVAKELGYSITYSTEDDALQSLQSEKRLILIVPSLKKKEVIENALKRILFVHKTTRHVVPARPLFTNVPLSWLKTTDIKEANQQLNAHLNNKQIIKKDPGSIIDGRRYEERAYLFSD
ncbi:MAG: ParB N-terminal domain-containing protein [Promethearchaeota archaeon]